MKACHLSRTLGTAAVLALLLCPSWTKGAEPALEPFRGITTDGTVKTGLYKAERTGVAVEAMAGAAQKFLSSLSSTQREKTQFPATSEIKRRWNNVSAAKRYGISYEEMTSAQRQYADDLLKAFLSEEGFRQSKDIMLINGYLAEATGNHQRYGAEQFWISVYGDPGKDKAWAWRLEGHHLVISVNIVGNQVVMTPTFMGAEPTVIPAGRHRGVAVMQEQEATARALIASLSEEQVRKAQLSKQKQGSNMLTEAYKDNAIVPQEGLQATTLSERQQRLLMAVIESFASQFRKELTAERLKEIRKHLNDTTFLWIGGSDQEAPIYYRIQSPVILIEFDQQRALSLPGDPEKPIRTHVHSIVRTPNGNDYGEDLLQQHLREHHSHGETHEHESSRW